MCTTDTDGIHYCGKAHVLRNASDDQRATIHNSLQWYVEESRKSVEPETSTTEEHTHQWTYGYMVRTCWCGSMERATHE